MVNDVTAGRGDLGGRPLFDDVMPRYHIGGRLSHELTFLPRDAL